MDLQVGTEIAIGPPMMFSDVREDEFAPEWVGPQQPHEQAQQERLDWLMVLEQIKHLRSQVEALTITADRADMLLLEIHRRLYTPWYKRLWNWLTKEI